MANPLRGEVPFSLPNPDKEGDHKFDDYVLGFDVNRLCEVEALLGRAAGEVQGEISKGNMTVIRAFMWGGLRSYDLSLYEAGDVANELTPLIAGPLLYKALAGAFPSEAGKSKASPRRAAKAAKAK